MIQIEGDDPIVIFRRGVIIFCIVLLCANVITVWPGSKYYDPQLEKEVNAGNAQVIEVNKSFMIDNDTMKILRIIKTTDRTYIRYALVKKEDGWTFPHAAISMTDDKGHQYQCFGLGSSGKSWGEEGLFQSDPIAENAKNLTIKFQRFDRISQLTIPLHKEEN